jgi:hypothetical protein
LKPSFLEKILYILFPKTLFYSCVKPTLDHVDISNKMMPTFIQVSNAPIQYLSFLLILYLTVLSCAALNPYILQCGAMQDTPEEVAACAQRPCYDY